ncbi:DUF4199 family protein [Mesonia sp. K7]|uniref:DUF4199 family protein n=1 Tax=Mesonia sp. K7 TaxID=2218606 RepID=UPI000DA773D1|nr:DUF4199 family protein [Mesonia sp. K7]PZD78953.1 DUF4199 domain-containing protein [Mesonia sp. K7]
MKINAIQVKYALFIAIALIAYFLLLSVFGLSKYPAFSIFNGLIMAIGLYFCIRDYKRYKGKKYKYQKGFLAGLICGFLATLIFTAFFGVYASHFNPDFATEILSTWENEYSESLGLLLFVVAVMGFCTTLVLTLAYMQLMKDSWNTTPIKNQTRTS